MSTYDQQVRCPSDELDMDFWRKPEGVSVPDDELEFLLVPDVVESRAVFDVSIAVHEYQSQQGNDGSPITSALIVTMGGMLPGVLLYDHLVDGRLAGVDEIEFGTIGVSLYEGPGVRFDEPKVEHGISIPISGQTVLLVDDLGDRGGTMAFLKEYVTGNGAANALSLALYMKPAAIESCPADFCFGEAAQDTWIITPRELVETLVKRVPVWKERGASEAECKRRLVELIGYPQDLVDYYLPRVYQQ